MSHIDVIKRLKEGYGTPVSIQIAPTSRCNLSCSFCSNINRTKHEDIDFEKLVDLIVRLRECGLKTVEYTGGGDPTLYEGINELMTFCTLLGIKQGMITNGVVIREKIDQQRLDRLTWLRISMNCLDYINDVDIPKIKGTLGFSYVWNEKTTLSTIEKLKAYVFKYSPAYVRIVPNCQATDEQQDENNRVLGETIAKLGRPFFYQAKTFQKPDKCYWGYLKPFVNSDGYVFRCSSVVLNYDAGRKFHESYKWCDIETLVSKYKEKIVPFNPVNCNHCVFSAQNNMLDSILNPTGMEDFI